MKVLLYSTVVIYFILNLSGIGYADEVVNEMRSVNIIQDETQKTTISNEEQKELDTVEAEYADKISELELRADGLTGEAFAKIQKQIEKLSQKQTIKEYEALISLNRTNGNLTRTRELETVLETIVNPPVSKTSKPIVKREPPEEE